MVPVDHVLLQRPQPAMRCCSSRGEGGLRLVEGTVPPDVSDIVEDFRIETVEQALSSVPWAASLVTAKGASDDVTEELWVLRGCTGGRVCISLRIPHWGGPGPSGVTIPHVIYVVAPSRHHSLMDA